MGSATRKAASLFTGAGPGATAAFSASTPPLMKSLLKSLRHSRTASSRTPNASATRAPAPASQRQQHGTGAVRLAAIARAGQNHQRRSLRLVRRERRFSPNVLHLPIAADRESTLHALGNHAESA
jgi:hypothetical protein